MKLLIMEYKNRILHLLEEASEENFSCSHWKRPCQVLSTTKTVVSQCLVIQIFVRLEDYSNRDFNMRMLGDPVDTADL